MEYNHRFGTVDYIVLSLSLVIPFAMSIYFSCLKKEKSTKENYLLGGRTMSKIPTAMSLFVTFQSAIALTGIATEYYRFGSMFLFFTVGQGISYILSLFTLIPLLRPLHVTSGYKYLELRFESKSVRLLGTCFGMLGTFIYMGIVLFAPALAIETVSGLPFWFSVVLVGGIGIAYTSLGGMKTVIWTDVFQCILLLIGITAIIIRGIMEIGGLSNMWNMALEGGRINFSEINPDPRVRHSIWGLLIGGCFTWMVNNYNQASIQRISSMRSVREAQMAFLLIIPTVLFFGLILWLQGLIVYAYFHSIKCDPLASGRLFNPNQIVPYFVQRVLGFLNGFPGLFVATLFCGALSTLSSGINSLAALTLEDILERPLKHVSEKTSTIIAKILVCVYGVMAIGIAYLAQVIEGPISTITLRIFGATGGPLTGIFILGATFPWANWKGALFGGIIAIGVNIWITVGGIFYGVKRQTLPPTSVSGCPAYNTTMYSNISSTQNTFTSLPNTTFPLVTEPELTKNSFLSEPFSIYDISYIWYSLIGIIVSIVMGLLISFITGPLKTKDVDARFMFPFARKLFKMKNLEKTTWQRTTQFEVVADEKL